MDKEEQKYSIDDFIYYLGKYANIDEKKYTQGQIASIIAKAMLNFFEDSETPY